MTAGVQLQKAGCAHFLDPDLHKRPFRKRFARGRESRVNVINVAPAGKGG